MRLMMTDEGPTRLSRLSNTQAVGRGTPRAAACLAVVSHPAATNDSRISASFLACLAFAFDLIGRRIPLLCPIFQPPSSCEVKAQSEPLLRQASYELD